MYNIVICDDDPQFIIYLKDVIGQCRVDKQEITYKEFTSAAALLKGLRQFLRQGISCDLLILDMQMEPGMDGNAVAKRFRELYPETMLVFCSGVYEPTDESFKTYPYRYLLKSYTQKRMLREMQSIMDKLASIDKVPYILGKYCHGILKIKVSDILYFQNYKHGTVIHPKDGALKYNLNSKFITSDKLEQLFEKYGQHGFEYAHNSFLVNMDHVVNIDTGGFLILDNGARVSISRSRMKAFKDAFTKRMGSKY